ncbi:MAG: DNRLRE domain-containing protein [Desulfobacterium sp.]|nr:DNRLRE domain-containing protein [Desulfobacterium sp.]
MSERIVSVGVFFFFLLMPFMAMGAAPVIIDHDCTRIGKIPESAIEKAVADLHIAYGHTSHGSQLISGMGTSNGSQLDAFMTANGATPGLYRWNKGGTDNALDLHNYFVPGDLGNPDRTTWAQRTRAYLDTPVNSAVNVVIWSWCGQAATSTANIDIYLNLMEGLIADYPDVKFVFMTGHLNGSGPLGQLNLANEHIRAHCRANNRILYDFADIESYDPDGQVNYMALNGNDNCDYDTDNNGSLDRNWAREWQESHTLGVDWWASGAAHSQHLNGNRKGYAAWWLWATLAGWKMEQCMPPPSHLTAVADAMGQKISLAWQDNSREPNECCFLIQRRVDGGDWDDGYARVDADVTRYEDTDLVLGSYSHRVVARLDPGPGGEPCESNPSNTVSAVISIAVPAPPSGLASQVDGFDIMLSWNDDSDNEEGFIVQRKIDGEGFEDLGTVLPNSDAYVDSSLAPLHTYTYRVKAVNSFGGSDYSNETAEYLDRETMTITLKQGVGEYGGCMDAYLDSANPSTNFGDTRYEYVENAPKANLAIRFDLPEQIKNREILGARLIFYCWSVLDPVPGNHLELYRITQPWHENSATWESNTPGQNWTSPGGTYDPVFLDSCPIENQSYYPGFDITQAVQQWSRGILDNNGVILINNTGTRTGIKASEYDEYARPSLEITYGNTLVCLLDNDHDNDVDGWDLALFAAGFEPGCMNAFAGAFGK